jgi:hypothetical protein
MWPGADVNFSHIGAPRGGLPTYGLPYNRGVAPAARVAWVLEQLARPVETQPRLATLYLEAIDDAGHRSGPDSLEVRAAVQEADRALVALLAGLEGLRAESRRRLHVVVVGDHGMVGTCSERVRLGSPCATSAARGGLTQRARCAAPRRTRCCCSPSSARTRSSPRQPGRRAWASRPSSASGPSLAARRRCSYTRAALSFRRTPLCFMRGTPADDSR